MQSLPAPGSEVVIRRERWRIERAFVHGGVIEVDAVRLAAPAGRATFFAPFDAIIDAPRRPRPRRVRRQRWTALVRHFFATADRFDLPIAAQPAGIALMPHQLEPCLAALGGVRRILVADDVGLGKTIEAGLIVAELLRRGEATRVLILTPATLARQWQDELRQRFDIAAEHIDADALRQSAHDLPPDVNPWSIDGVRLASIDFIKQPHLLSTLPPAPWDLVVIDEAHGVCGDSTRHDAAMEIASNARRVILLTATPDSGDETTANRLRALGSLDAADSTDPIDELIVFRRMRLDVGPAPLRRIRRLRVTAADVERRTLDLLGRFGETARGQADAETSEATRLLLAVFNKRALSTFAALLLSIDRRLALLDRADAAPPVDAEQLALGFGDEDDAALAGRIGLPADRERAWLRRLRALASAAARSERKLATLGALIRRTTEPAIVFTEFVDSLLAVERGLGGVAVAIAHGGLPPATLAEACEAFRSGRARVLIATDVASQGLNLHHRCRWVIHLDRPWNPVRLEQRAGRVDRLGQVRDVHVTELMTAHDREFELAERVDARARAAATREWLRPCDRWRRRGRAAARVLSARRALARSWRGPARDRRPVARKRDRDSFPLALRDSRAGNESRSLFLADIRDREGRVVEQVLWRGAGAPRLSARLKRLARPAAERAERAAAVARALRARALRRVPAQLALPGAPQIAHAEAAEQAPAHAEIAKGAGILSASTPRLVALEFD